MSRTNNPVPYGESWTCTHGECCTDEACERRTLIAVVITVIVMVVIGVIGIIELLV